jgi:hypothetical protein
MKRAGVFIFVLFMVLSMTSTAFAKKHDLQYWHTDSVSWKFDKDWKFTFGEEGRLNDTASHAWYQELDMGIVYSGVAKWLDLSFNFKHALSESNNKWRREEWTHLNATLKTNIKGYSISSRSRLEYRMRQDVENTWRFRDMVTVKLPCKFTRYEIQPFVADEILVDLDQKQLSENRGYAGLTFKINKHLSADVYYMKQRLKAASITYNDIVGTRFNFSF